MKVLIACEFSGTVREAFRKIGHDAWSCDIVKSDDDSPHHIQEDVLKIINDRWDMMIAFPPCTHLAVSGAKHFAKKREDGRQQQGIDFFMSIVNAPVSLIAVENPVGIMSSIYRKPDQIINPYEFGHNVSKKTCLWLKNLPFLKATNIVDKGEYITFPSGKRMHKWYADKAFGGEARQKVRNKTFQGIADAMAQQWGNI
jgi:site-specific DNA-cytosine methylase